MVLWILILRWPNQCNGGWASAGPFIVRFKSLTFVVLCFTLSCLPFFLECLIIGTTYNCNCSEGYIWSNEVCSTHQCCGETTCRKNLDDVTPVCVAKAEGKNLPVCLGCCASVYLFNGVIMFLYQFASVDQLHWRTTSLHSFMTPLYAATHFQI